MIEEQHPAYITIVEGPPPEFNDAANEWTIGVMEGTLENSIAVCEMRTFNGPELVKRCQAAWHNNRPARLDFPTGNGNERSELDIVAARWEAVDEGHKLYLWVKI